MKILKNTRCKRYYKKKNLKNTLSFHLYLKRQLEEDEKNFLF